MKWFAIFIVFMLLSSFSFKGGEKLEIKEKFDFSFKANDALFDELILSLMNMAHMSALSAAIIKENEVIWAKGYGLYDREKGKEAKEDTIYLVASISKTFTATAIMQLYEKGYLDLDDDVNKYLPFSLRNPNYPDEPITIRMLLAHQSSLAEDPLAFYCHFPGDLKIERYPYPWLKEYLTPDGIHYKPQIWEDYKPGEEMRYANVGYSILGYIVELITNVSFEEYCQKYIFKPLKMQNTSFELMKLNISKIAVPYSYYRGKYHPWLHYAILDYPAGGLRTNVLDLSRFLIAHMNGGVYNGIRILKEESIEEMHKVQYHSKRYVFQYGLGFQIWKIGGETYIGHTGGLYGVATKMVFRQSDKVGIIFFTNKEVSNLNEIIAFSLIERLLFWKATHNKKELTEDIIKETIEINKHLMENELLLNTIHEEKTAMPNSPIFSIIIR